MIHLLHLLRLRRCCVATLCLAGLLHGAAFAQAPAPNAAPAGEAAKLYESGAKHYNLAEYVEALADFKAAYRVVPDAAFLFNIGQAHRQLGESEEAAQAYRAYLRVATKVTPEKRAAVEKFIADADAIVRARAAQVGPTGVEAPTGDGVSAGSSAFPGLIQPVQPARREKPVYKQWWFWTIGGLVVGGGLAAGIAVPLAGRPEDPIQGTLGTVNAQ